MTVSGSSRATTAVEWLLLAMLVAEFVVFGFLPAWRVMNTDFPNYYLAAVIHRQGIPLDRAYEWRWFQRHKDYLQIDQPLVGFAPHPPMVALPMLPLAKLPPMQAKRVWLLLNLGFLALSLGILRRVTDVSWRRILILAFLCILPLREQFLFGQYYLAILLLLCAAYWAAVRERRFASGILLAAAASLKVFPVFFLILFVRKRNWRAVAGMVIGGAALGAISVAVFGWNVHKIYLLEVLPRALHGDLVGPYVLQWNSFTALCHRFFLAEPELNPAPWMNSIAAYSGVQALIATMVLFAFLLSTGDEETPRTRAWEWATFLSALILLSSMPTAYHHCVLILTIVVATDLLLKDGEWRIALQAIAFYALACFPLPGFLWLSLQGRLLGDLLLFLLLLWKAPARATGFSRKVGYAMAAIFFAYLTLSNLRALRGRSEDFSARIPSGSAGYATFSVTSTGERLLLDEMIFPSYGMAILPGGAQQKIGEAGDVLAVAASKESPYIYFEVTNLGSKIFRMATAQLGSADAKVEFVAEGRDPAISSDGHWLAFLHDECCMPMVWVSHDSETPKPLPARPGLGEILEIAVTNDGRVIAASNPADPRLTLLTLGQRGDEFSAIGGAVRYPAVSADGGLLAFSRREAGAWQLYIRSLKTGEETRLTSGACNATSPAWGDGLYFVTDCGRGLGLGAPARLAVGKN